MVVTGGLDTTLAKYARVYSTTGFIQTPIFSKTSEVLKTSEVFVFWL